MEIAANEIEENAIKRKTDKTTKKKNFIFITTSLLLFNFSTTYMFYLS